MPIKSIADYEIDQLSHNSNIPTLKRRNVADVVRKDYLMNGKQLAKLFHETYERLAPDYGYLTRKETKQFDENTPNGKLMIATCSEILNNPIAQQSLSGSDDKCCRCGKVGDDVTYGPDPFAEEIAGDDTPVWECEECRYQSAMDI